MSDELQGETFSTEELKKFLARIDVIQHRLREMQKQSPESFEAIEALLSELSEMKLEAMQRTVPQ
jgi:hypothetical protein